MFIGVNVCLLGIIAISVSVLQHDKKVEASYLND